MGRIRCPKLICDFGPVANIGGGSIKEFAELPCGVRPHELQGLRAARCVFGQCFFG